MDPLEAAVKTVVPVGGLFWGAQARKGVGLHHQQDEFDELLRLEFRTLDTKRPRWLKQRHPHIGLLLFARSGWFLFLVQKIPRLDFHHVPVATSQGWSFDR